MSINKAENNRCLRSVIEFQKCLGIKDMSDRLIYIRANRVASADGNVLRQNSRGQFAVVLKDLCKFPFSILFLKIRKLTGGGVVVPVFKHLLFGLDRMANT